MRLFLAALLAAGAVPAAAQQVDEVVHAISFPGLAQQYVRVRSEFPVSGNQAILRMASWTPGSYLIRDFSSDLDRISIRSEAGELLRFTKTGKNTWQVPLNGHTRLLVEYDVHAGDLSVNTSWVSSEFVLINGASVFLYTDHSRTMPHRVRVQAPQSLGRVMTPLPQSGNSNEFLASSFDELVDSPVLIDDTVAHRFSHRGHDYNLLNVGSTELWDGPQSALDVRAIVAATNDFWGVIPLDRDYWFFNILVENNGGLEHDHSTVIMGSRWQMLNREDYIKWLSLVAHEYFHSWNMRRMRPLNLAHYDYEKEQYSRALWFAEGISSYYDNLMLSRAKLVSPDEYFKRLAIDLHKLETTPGRKLISLEQASHDAWIRHYQPDANSQNSTISYYTKGAILGLVLDTRIRKTTSNRFSLDDVMRRMYQRWGKTPYPDDAFLDAVESVAGTEVRAWLGPLLNTAARLEVDEALDWYGLVLDRHPVNTAAKANAEPLETGFGASWEKDVPGLIVSSVVHGSSGSRAGLLPGDELLAISGERITRDTLEDRMLRLQPGNNVELLISRRGRIMTIALELEESRPATFEVLLDPDFGKRQLRRLESWLGQSLQVKR